MGGRSRGKHKKTTPIRLAVGVKRCNRRHRLVQHLRGDHVDYLSRVRSVLNYPIRSDIKGGYTKGWAYVKSRKVHGCIEIGFVCPKGRKAKDAEDLIPALRAACGHDIEVLDYKGRIVVRVCTEQMPPRRLLKPTMLESLRSGEILIGYDRLGTRITFNWEQAHGIIGAQTGMGKTDFIRLFVLCLLLAKEPISIRIVDLKMLSFLPFKNAPNVHLGVGWDGANKLLQEIAEEVQKRNEEVYKSGTRETAKKFKRIVIIIDEAAEISPDVAVGRQEKAIAKQMEAYISTIVRMGREVKVHLIYCTQYPTAKLVSNQIKINCGMRLCLGVETPEQSTVVLGRPGAELLDLPGRAIFKGRGYSMVQIPYLGGDPEWEKMMKLFKQEGTHGTANLQGKNTTSAPQPTGGNHQSTESAISEHNETAQAFERTLGRALSRQEIKLGMAWPGENLEADEETESTDEWFDEDL